LLALDIWAFTIITDGDARRVFELTQWTVPLHRFARDGGGREQRSRC
jgi:hypothetical protein